VKQFVCEHCFSDVRHGTCVGCGCVYEVQAEVIDRHDLSNLFVYRDGFDVVIRFKEETIVVGELEQYNACKVGRNLNDLVSDIVWRRFGCVYIDDVAMPYSDMGKVK
jgi:hypothetical protein